MAARYEVYVQAVAGKLYVEPLNPGMDVPEELDRIDSSPRIPFIRVLGPLSCEWRGSRLRSRTAGEVLGILVARSGREVSKYELAEWVWPNSDGDRQDQNLRKALSDIRTVLSTESNGHNPVIVRGGRVSINSEQIESDLWQFQALAARALAAEDIELLLGAARTYGGSLLPDCEIPQIIVQRSELEQRFADVVQLQNSILLRNGRAFEAVEVALTALQVAPFREEIHIALIQAYGAAGQAVEAIRRFEELESLLDHQWGESPSERAVTALNSIERTSNGRKDRPSMTPGSVYVRRRVDDHLDRSIQDGEPTILVQGPRQVGKTTMLGRVLKEARTLGVRVVVTDFQALNSSQLESLEALYRSLATSFMIQLGVKVDIATLWEDWMGPNSNFETVIEAILAETKEDVVWAMDEADRLFGASYSDDFFGLLRSWHNRHKLNPGGRWGRLKILISYATEASLFIQNIHHSPFNVGVRVVLNDFSRSELTELASQQYCCLSDSELDELWTLTQGHPFLSRAGLDYLIDNGLKISDLETQATAVGGPFSDHLQRLLGVIQRDPQVCTAVSDYLGGIEIADRKLAARLVAGGLMRSAESGLEFRVPVYGRYLAEHRSELG